MNPLFPKTEAGTFLTTDGTRQVPATITHDYGTMVSTLVIQDLLTTGPLTLYHRINSGGMELSALKPATQVGYGDKTQPPVNSMQANQARSSASAMTADGDGRGSRGATPAAIATQVNGKK